jgi:allophanate hydrolase subunit 1
MNAQFLVEMLWRAKVRTQQRIDSLEADIAKAESYNYKDDVIDIADLHVSLDDQKVELEMLENSIRKLS